MKISTIFSKDRGVSLKHLFIFTNTILASLCHLSVGFTLGVFPQIPIHAVVCEVMGFLLRLLRKLRIRPQ